MFVWIMANKESVVEIINLYRIEYETETKDPILDNLLKWLTVWIVNEV